MANDETAAETPPKSTQEQMLEALDGMHPNPGTLDHVRRNMDTMHRLLRWMISGADPASKPAAESKLESL